MRPEKKSPATSAQVHRARKARQQIIDSTVSQYHGIADLVEQNPDAHAVDVYAGKQHAGTIFQVGRQHHAFGCSDDALGVFPDRRAASTSIHRAFTGSLPPT